ncbi:MAG: cysteine--tRNA ligase, partial [Candidatus Asgardarchaeum californiense]
MRIYNTLSKQVEEFKAVNPPEVRMYVCGPTVYDYSHIGHARTYIVFDTFRKFLTYIGYNVKYVQNITDVDDKIINRANKEGMNPKELSEKFTREYFYDMKSLGIEIADIQPKVTEHIQDIIEIVKTLIDKGFAYNVSGDVYFDVTKFSGYGKLSGQTLEDIKAGARVAIDERKRNPADFALWKKAKPNEPFWDSPWGKGRPGWHIECSAMSMRYLEVPFD